MENLNQQKPKVDVPVERLNARNAIKFSPEYLKNVFGEWAKFTLVAEGRDGSSGTSLTFSKDSKKVEVEIEYWPDRAVKLLSTILNRPESEIQNEIKKKYHDAEEFSLSLPDVWTLELGQEDFRSIKLSRKGEQKIIETSPDKYRTLITKTETSMKEEPIVVSVSQVLQDKNKKWLVFINQGMEELIRYPDFIESEGRLKRDYSSSEECDAASEIYSLVKNAVIQLDKNGKIIFSPDRLPTAVGKLFRIYYQTKLVDLKEKLRLSEKFWPKPD